MANQANQLTTASQAHYTTKLIIPWQACYTSEKSPARINF